jgi:histidinol-phosphatase
MNLQPYLDFTTSVAYRAGRITLGYFNTGIRPDLKKNEEPVTSADHAAERSIRAETERMYHGHAIIGEEFRVSEGDGNPFRWTVDPIDGRITFVRGVPLYSVLIAMEIEGGVKVGAAYFPALDEMIYAAEGLGCWWNGRRARVSEVGSLSKACVCCSDLQNLSKKTHFGRSVYW